MTDLVTLKARNGDLVVELKEGESPAAIHLERDIQRDPERFWMSEADFDWFVASVGRLRRMREAAKGVAQ